MKRGISLIIILLLYSCKQNPDTDTTPTNTSEIGLENTITYANGFRIRHVEGYTEVDVLKPWTNSEQEFHYVFIPDSIQSQVLIDSSAYDAIVTTPVKSIVVTSTTHIPVLEALGVENLLQGFPDTRYISSPKTATLVKEGVITELGINEAINTEVLVALDPDVVVGFSINNQNRTYDKIAHAGIPVVYNGDWVEEHPLGKAEWIRFFGVIFEKEALADSLFNSITENYNAAVKLATLAHETPTVMSGAMFKDIWYLPAGKSWAAQFFKDANADYLWAETAGSGSLSLNFESVLATGRNADYWIGTAGFTSYADLDGMNNHYKEFDAYKNRRTFTFSKVKGEGGGVLYYELAPNRPDLVLKDLIRVLHPDLLEAYEPVFIKPLD
ncbi:ABC transporter substrate-binding protein [Robertkochia solimangrovi]|uniref:ABC transporter substrate-binding protein n=1 Tax=Robertkochia solimangrovi TaxID=2213046 RepID=UPI00117E98D8|nr:ABC transporter substrate-binding protein [Robertkochia solimangrovi]TRZ43654.1 ABC transporter substrate-binding protein [Robertkochia solimangrovi]